MPAVPSPSRDRTERRRNDIGFGELSDQRLSGGATITATDLDQTPTHEGINNAVVILTIQW